MKWYKASNNLISDSELKLVSHKAGVKHYVTVVTFHSLLERCSKNGSCVFSKSNSLADEIAIDTGLDIEDIKSCLSWLEKQDKIAGNTLINWDKYQESTSTQRVREWREKKANETLHNVSNVSVTNVTQKRGEESREENKEIVTKVTIKKNFILPDWIDESVWQDYCEMRSRIKKSLTDRAKQLVIMDLEKLGGDANEILNQSTKNSWQGVFAIKQQNGGIYGKSKSSTERAMDAANRGLQAYRSQQGRE